MFYIWLVMGVALTVEAFVRIGFFDRATRLLATINKAMKVVSSSAISDHWKEKILPSYSGRLMADSLMLFVLMLLAFLPITLMSVAADALGAEMTQYLASWTGILVSTGIATVYVMLRKRLVKA